MTFNFILCIECGDTSTTNVSGVCSDCLRERSDTLNFDEGNETGISLEDADSKATANQEERNKLNPYEGLDGFHNQIGGYSCPNCHDFGCHYCMSNEQLYS